MKNQSRLLKGTFFASLLAGAFVTVSSADIIYQDKFDRTGTLNGSAPTLDNAGSATWTASAGYLTTGTNALVNNSGGDWQGGAYLPLDWTTAYPDPRAQVDVRVTGDWLALTLGTCQYWGPDASTAMLKVWGNGNVDVCHGFGWAGDFVITNVVGAANVGEWNRLRIEYSNTVGTATFYVDGNIVAKDVPITSNSTGVGLNSNNGSDSYFTNFLVTFGNESVSPPSIGTQPQSVTVFVGDTAHLSAGTAGTLPLHYVWRKNGVDIPGPDANAYSISNAAVADSGDYSLVVTNSYGAKTSEVARLDVHLEAQSPIAQNNFDDPVPVAYTFSFTYSSDGTLTLPSRWTNEPSVGAGGTAGSAIYADGTAFADASVTYAGFGGGWAQDIAPLPTHNLLFYECYFSAKVQNLKDSVTNTPGRIAVRFFAPDGTTGATNGQPDLIFSVENSYSYTSNFQSFAFKLNSGNYGGDTGQAAFNQYQSAINRVQFEFTADNFYTDFVNGPGDAIVVDNAKLALRQSPAIRVAYNGSQPVLSWDDPNLQLQGAVDVTGPYVLIPNVTSSPYPVPGNSPYHYFRTTFTALP